MKKIVSLAISLIFVSSCFSQIGNVKQDIIGVWQLSSPEIGSAYLDNYQFFENGEFKFNISEYDGLKQITSIKGKYTAYVDSINFKPVSIILHTGGDRLERSKFTSNNDSWSLIGKFIKKEILLKNQDSFSAYLEFKKSSKGQLIIEIDGTEYFLMLKDPNKY